MLLQFPLQMPKDKEELAAQLEYDQQRWDNQVITIRLLPVRKCTVTNSDIAKEFAMNGFGIRRCMLIIDA